MSDSWCTRHMDVIPLGPAVVHVVSLLLGVTRSTTRSQQCDRHNHYLTGRSTPLVVFSVPPLWSGVSLQTPPFPVGVRETHVTGLVVLIGLIFGGMYLYTRWRQYLR